MKTEEKEFLKARKVAEDIAKIINNRAKKGDYPAFDEYVRNDEKAEDLLQRLVSEDRASNFFKNTSSAEIAENSRKLVHDIRVIKRRKRFIARLSAVAAAVAVLSFVVYSVVSRDNLLSTDYENIQTTAQLLSVPVIVAENGTRIDLSTLQDTIIIDGAVIHRSENNRFSCCAADSMRTAEVKIIVPSRYSMVLILDDGTEVFLNANSELKYPTKFLDGQREVSLKGEAYFKVAKSDKPFIVNINTMYVKVYGTEFNIRAYDKMVETVLLEGSVGVGGENGDEVKIRPNERCVWNEDNDEYKVTKTIASEHIAWIDGLFQYNDKPLSSIVKDFETWYGVTFVNELPKDMNLSLYLKRDTCIEEVLSFIETINTSVEFIKEKGVYYIRNK